MEKFWKQVFIASISSGSSPEISMKKADKAVQLLQARSTGKVEERKITLDSSLNELLPAGVVNCLRGANIEKVGDFDGVTLRKLIGIRNFGEGAMKNVTELLTSYTNTPISIFVPLKLKPRKK